MNKEERLRDGQEVWVKGVIKGRSDAEAVEGYFVLLHGEEEDQWFVRAALIDPAPLELLIARLGKLPGDMNTSIEFQLEDLRAVRDGSYDPHLR